jgi:hypothetical protein
MSSPDISPVNCAVAVVDWAAAWMLLSAAVPAAAGADANNDRAR